MAPFTRSCSVSNAAISAAIFRSSGSIRTLLGDVLSLPSCRDQYSLHLVIIVRAIAPRSSAQTPPSPPLQRALDFSLPLSLALRRKPPLLLVRELLAPAPNHAAPLRFDLLKIERRRRSISLRFRRRNVPVEDQRVLRECSMLTFELP